MKRPLFYRNVRAQQQLDVFLISAIASLLLIRFFLHVTGYPQIGGGGLHIAHMLYGGLLMAASITLNLAFLGVRIQRTAALLGGVGFGFFIDEIGKFVTSNNDYFYQPAVGIIYAVFVMLYLTFNFLGRTQKLSSREYQLNAVAQLEEAIARDMDQLERRHALELLKKAHASPMTRQLTDLINSVSLVPENEPSRLSRILSALDRRYTSFWRGRSSRHLVRLFFIAEAAVFVIAVSWGIYTNLDDITAVVHGSMPNYDFWLYVGQFMSSLVAAGFAVVGAVLLKASRTRAFEQFRRATLINLFLTEFFIFSRIEFEALAGFFFNVAILLFISYVIHQEKRLRGRTAFSG